MAFTVSGTAGLAWLTATRRLAVLRQDWPVWLHGVGGLFGFHALYFASLAYAPAPAASLINYTWPLLIVLLSAPLLGLRLTRRHAVGVAVALAGCILLLGRGAAFPPGAALGYACAAGSALIWAAYSVLARRFQSVPSAALAGFCAATAVLAGLAHAATERSVMPTPLEGFAILALGIGPVGAAFMLWDFAMKHSDPRLLGTLAFATPVLSTLFLAASSRSTLTAGTILAAILVAAGGAIAARGGR